MIDKNQIPPTSPLPQDPKEANVQHVHAFQPEEILVEVAPSKLEKSPAETSLPASKEGPADTAPPQAGAGVADKLSPPSRLDLKPVNTAAPLASPPRRKRKRSSFGMQVGLVVVLILFLIVAASGVAQLFTLYDVHIAGSADGLELTLIPRLRDEEQVRQPFGDQEQDLPPLPELLVPEDHVEWIDPAAPIVTLGDGTTMELYPPGDSPRLSFQEIFQRCAPSVVLVEVEFGNLFFGTGSGSGVVMTESGYIITSAHVVEGASRIAVVLIDDGSRHPAALVGYDRYTDIAVLKINAPGLTPAAFGDSDLLQVGEEVAAIGNPLGHVHTMTQGIISALEREVFFDGVTMRLIQTSAPINEGNSGGPLINLYGQVVGITNMKLIGTQSTVEGMGFAVPTAQIKPVVDAIIQHGYVPGRPSIGIIVQTVDAYLAAAEGIHPGLYVLQVAPNTDAAAQGLLPGDQIIAFNGQAVFVIEDLRDLLDAHQVDDVIRLSIRRDGRELTLDIRLMDSALVNH